jgi:hypothetical protein
MEFRPPLWGNFVYYADHDLLSFGLLMKGGLMVPAMYHGTQALEKYFKALSLSIIDPKGETETFSGNNWLRNHSLEYFANRCGVQYSYYIQPDILDHLRRFSEYDQAARYPWVNTQYSNGFSTADIPVFEELIRNLRSDLPIISDDYPLGILVRGHHHLDPKTPINTSLDNLLKLAVISLREIFSNVDILVRW